MVDMGSLIWFAEQISEETGREVISMEMVSTIMVIDTLRKILMENHCIKEICTQSGFELDGVSGRKRQRKYREKQAYCNLIFPAGEQQYAWEKLSEKA